MSGTQDSHKTSFDRIIQDLKELRDGNSAVHQNLETQKQTYEFSIQKLKNDLEDAKKYNESADAQVLSLRAQISVIDKDKKGLQDDLQGLEQKYKVNLRALSAVTDLNKQLSEHFTERGVDVEQYRKDRSRITQLDHAVDELTGKISQKNSIIEENSAELQNMIATLKNKDERIAELEAEIQSQTPQILLGSKQEEIRDIAPEPKEAEQPEPLHANMPPNVLVDFESHNSTSIAECSSNNNSSDKIEDNDSDDITDSRKKFLLGVLHDIKNEYLFKETQVKYRKGMSYKLKKEIQKMERPLRMDEIRTKLNAGQYKTIADFTNDVDDIFGKIIMPANFCASYRLQALQAAFLYHDSMKKLPNVPGSIESRGTKRKRTIDESNKDA